MKLYDMKILKYIALSILSTCIMFACQDGSSTLGNSLVNDISEVVIDSSFTLTGSSYRDDAVLSRTTNQLLGVINAREFGSLSSDFVTQFMPAQTLDTTGVSVNDIDSVRMLMFYNQGSFTGDSLVPMGFKVYPLKKQLEAPIYSNFNPSDYYDESDCWTSQPEIYTAHELNNDTVSGNIYKRIIIKLPLSFGKKVFNEYLNNPATFNDPQSFARFFPGLYVKNTFGSGRVTNIFNTRINFYYSKHSTYTKDDVERDTIYNLSATYMAVTPEIITNNIINYTLSSSLRQMVSDGQTLLVAPTGYNARLIFPGREIIDTYRLQGGDMAVINSLSLELPAEPIDNTYGINPPANVLLVLESEKESFFANNKINDEKTSFLATYDSTNNRYVFTGLRAYIISLLSKENIEEKDVTFSLVPVDLTTESSGSDYYYGTTTTYVTGIQPYVNNPAMCKLNLDKAKIRFTYSKQSIKN